MHIARLKMAPAFKHESLVYRETWTEDFFQKNLSSTLTSLPNRLHFIGVDFGRTVDLSVFVVLTQRQDLSLSAGFVLELSNVPFEQQKQLFYFVADSAPRFMAAALDGTGNGAYLAEVATQRYGATRIEEVKLSQEWYRENMPKLIAHVEDGTLVLPKDADILADLRAIQKVNGVPQIPRNARTDGQNKSKRHGDAAVALAMGVYAADVMDSGPIEFMPVPKRAGENEFEDDTPEFDQGGY